MNNLKLILFCTIISFASFIQASEKNILLRLDRLERMVQNNSQTEVLIKLKQLQLENQELRSQIEEVSYQNDKLKNRLHSLNEDMDRRVLLLESERVEKIDQAALSQQQPIKEALETENQDNKNSTNQENSEDANLNTAEEKQFIEQKAYESAFNELKAQRYGKAGESFSLFLQQYPQSSYAPLAQYWLAESSYAQRDFIQSIKNYTALLNNYPTSQKLSEATLKIAYCHYELGEIKIAKTKLQELVMKYPKSTEAGQAKRLLTKLK